MALVDFLAQVFNGGLEQWIGNGYYELNVQKEINECIAAFGLLSNHQIITINQVLNSLEAIVEPETDPIMEYDEGDPELIAILEVLDELDDKIYKAFPGEELYDKILAWSE